MPPVNVTSAQTEGSPSETSPKANKRNPVFIQAQSAKSSVQALSNLSYDHINAALIDLSHRLIAHADDIISANILDLNAAKQKNLSSALIDRLTLDETRVHAMAQSVQAIAKLADPTGRILWETHRPNGLHIQRVSVPIGLLGIIYESRPNVTIDAAALSLKSRNACLLRGGSEAFNTALCLHTYIQESLSANDVPPQSVSMIQTSDRAAVGDMLACSKYIDVIVPRGGRSLIERVMSCARMPVFSHLDGLCHVYLHKDADSTTAREVTVNAKLRRTGVCVAAETLLIDKALCPSVAKDVIGSLIDGGCSLLGDTKSQALDPRIKPANKESFFTEHLAPTMNVAIVESLEAAIDHINHYGSHHTESIITTDPTAAKTFLAKVESAIVMHNASTQFSDGGEFGMGAEIGIATGKMHARGPVGVEQLCTYKYHVYGQGQTRPQ